MKPILYMLEASPASRAVSIVAKILDLTLDEREIDILNGEHLKEEYLKLNPLHTMPVLDDDGKIICDSHTINTYLISKHGKNDSLYPRDLYKRALVDQKLAFDLGTLFPILRTVDLAYMRKEIKALTPKMIEEIDNVYKFLEIFLKSSQWIALDCITVADIHCVTTVLCLDYHMKINPKLYPNTFNWIKRCQKLPCFESDLKRLQSFERFFDTFKK
ncbi:hypothetical protein FQR65_LT05818 [Abscondita terminalis]|nr:hypothetical protein FQR65_LT05818 [Abscondita terminalis]